MGKVTYIKDIKKVEGLPAGQGEKLGPVVEKFAFRTNDYYNSLIDWDDPGDPIRKIIIPDTAELDAYGRLDASDEESYTIVPGLQHKYTYTALLLVNDVCGGYCRFCFRKRLFMDGADEVSKDVSEGIEYIRGAKELNNILLTGGDPLLLSTARLDAIISELRRIDHVKIIRIGSKMPAFNPFRILDDPALLEMFERHCDNDRKLYLMAHFNHPRELTPEAREAMTRIAKAGVVTCNQTPLLRGVNDDPFVLGELFNELSYVGVPPYYLFQLRPTLGTRAFVIPVEEGFDIFEKARMLCSGTAKRARFVMSHATGKIEMAGKTDGKAYFRYHRAAEPREKARFMVFKSNPRAYWFDDYDEIVEDYSMEAPYRCFGPD
ncbi:MAG: KamA family radical SAM protein [Candidatus Nitrospinota bacterium M3_3B_026]